MATLIIRARNLRVLHRGMYSFGRISSSRLRPSGVISKAQAIVKAIGKPRIVVNTISLTIQFGISKNGKTCVAIWTKSHAATP
jgi:hypothetical protein